MRLYVNLDTLRLTRAIADNSSPAIVLKRGDLLALDLYLWSPTESYTDWQMLASGVTIRLGIKAIGDYDGTPLAATSDFAEAPTGEGATADHYAGTLDLNTVELSNALGYGDAEDVASIPANLEISWEVDGTTTSTQVARITIENDVIREDDPPSLLNPPVNLASLGSGDATAGQIPTADGEGGVDWADQPAHGARTLYYTTVEAATDNVETLAHWFTDSGRTVQATSLPTSIDTVYINRTTTTGLVGVLVCRICYAQDSTVLGTTVGGIFALFGELVHSGTATNGTGNTSRCIINGNAEFSGSAKNQGTINGNLLFSGTGFNVGTVNGDARFTGATGSYNTGTITGNASFEGAESSINPNGNHTGGVVRGEARFTGANKNAGTVHGNAYFHTSSTGGNTGTIYGSAFFGSSSTGANSGTIYGNIYFGTASTGGNSGTVRGNAYFAGSGTNSGTISGTSNGGIPAAFISDLYSGRGAILTGTPAEARDTIAAAMASDYKTASFTAVKGGRYHILGSVAADASVAITDPSSPAPAAGDVYKAVIVSGYVRIGSADYFKSRHEITRHYNGSAWETIAPYYSEAPDYASAIRASARANLGAGAVGDSLFTAPTAASARGTIGLVEYALRRTTDATARVSDVLTADDQIVIPQLTAGKAYVIEYVLPFSAAGAGGFKAVISGLSTLALSNTSIGRVYQASTSGDIQLTSDTLLAQRSSSTAGTSIQGVLYFVAATTHTPVFKWAQNTTDGTNTVLKANAIIMTRER